MQILEHFCDECGAANEYDATICVACSRPLRHAPEDAPAQQEEPDASPSSYIQITISSDAKTTIQRIQPQTQPATTLLHGRYEVLGKVGTGGFGAVYKARDVQNDNRMVAIKAIELDTLSASQAIEATDTFNRELNLLSALDHPHLPAIYEHFIDSTHWYLVMDFIDGEPLDEYLQQIQEASLPLKEVISIGLQLCDVLRYLHQLQPPIIFRDVKPANIMRTPGGRLYLIDFGIARRFKPGRTKDTTPLGSPGFAAPEQYGKAQTTARSDIYGLGATLYFLLTGYDPANAPFHLPPIRSLCPTLPQPLAELITSMLALDPANRPAEIAEVQQVLGKYAPTMRRTTVLAALPIGPKVQATRPARSTPKRSSHPLKTALKSLFTTLLTGAFLLACTLVAHVMGTASMPTSSSLPTGGSPPQLQLPQTFRMPSIGGLSSLDPFTTPASDAHNADLDNLLFRHLTTFDPIAHNTYLDLANSWDLSQDQLTWTFHLDPQATFSDGSPITSADVAASLNYALLNEPDAAICPLSGLVKDAKLLSSGQLSSLLNRSIVTPDRTTIRITTARPMAYFFAALTAPCTSIASARDLATFGNSAFAQDLAKIRYSGAYAVTQFKAGQTLVLTARTQVQQSSVYTPARVVVQFFQNIDASYNAYQAGQLDISPLRVTSSRQPDFFYLGAQPTLHYYGMNYLVRPLDNVSIRQALALAIDKTTLLKHLGLNTYDIATNSLLGRWSSTETTGSPALSINGNVVEARALLARGLQEENLGAFPPLAFAYQTGQPDQDIEIHLVCQIWRTELRIDVTPYPVANLAQAIASTRNNPRGLQIWATDYTPPYSDPQAWLSLPFGTDSPFNVVNFGQNNSARAIGQQKLQADLNSYDSSGTRDQSSTRSALYQDIESKFINEVAWLPMYLVTQPYVIDDTFQSLLSAGDSFWLAHNYCPTATFC